jgi:hypothetical protein
MVVVGELVVGLEENPEQDPCCLRIEGRRFGRQDHANGFRLARDALFRLVPG